MSENGRSNAGSAAMGQHQRDMGHERQDARQKTGPPKGMQAAMEGYKAWQNGIMKLGGGKREKMEGGARHKGIRDTRSKRERQGADMKTRSSEAEVQWV